MPGRIARSSVQSLAPSNVRSKARRRNLDAYATASHQTAEKSSIKASRLGEVVDDGSRRKRKRTSGVDDEEEFNSGDDRQARPAKKQQSMPGDDNIEHGSDSEGNEWTLGAMASGDEDSDLDSDEAFGESDEEKFEGFTFRGSSSTKLSRAKKPHQREKNSESFANPDLDEDEDQSIDSEEELERDGVDLATMLDDDVDEYADAAEGASDSRDRSESEEDDEDGDESVSLDSNTDDDDDSGADEERVARLHERLEAMDEDAGALRPKSKHDAAITVEDLLADLDTSVRKQFSAAIKTRKRSEAPKTLSAPLPKRQQDRLNREVASKKAKEQLDRWQDTVIHNRRADFLSFPLKDPNGADNIDTAKFSVDEKPRNKLEENIRKILEQSGMVSKSQDGRPMTEEDMILKAEELETNKLPVEEVMRRRAELRKSRELLFREEIKAKRIAKIKSKSYRRVHRRERQRQVELENEAREAAGFDHIDEDAKEHADRLRAEERMSTKHRSSKWAKTLKATNRATWDDGARDSVNEQARRNEELRRRIAGKQIRGDDGSAVEEIDSDIDRESTDDENNGLLRRLSQLEENTGESKADGLHNLKFMRAADERRRQQNDEDIKALRRELADEQEADDNSDEEINNQGLGRAVFGPGANAGIALAPKAKHSELEEGDDTDEEISAAQAPDSGVLSPSLKHNERNRGLSKLQAPSIQNTTDSTQSSHTENPWIEPSTAQHSSTASRPTARPPSKREQRRSRTLNDVATLDLDLSQPLKSKTKSTMTQATVQPSVQSQQIGVNAAQADNTDDWTVVKYDGINSNDDDSDADSATSGNAASAMVTKKQSYQARAFAGDDVEVAFETEKAEAMASEDEKEVSNHLPGWGSWTGEGLSKSIRKSNARQKHNPLFKHKLPGTKPSDRRDAKLANVIISEKKEVKGGSKKHVKYLTPVLPHEFERKDQYERSLRIPVGPEWTTKATFQRSTRPRVVVKPGTVISAMSKPLV